MARRRKSFGKSAYRMTPRRKAALRKAQLVSARKRKKNRALKVTASVGALALAGGSAYAGYKWGGNVKDIASSLRSRGFRFNNPANSPSGKITPESKISNVQAQAISPPTVAQSQAPRVQSPNLNKPATTPKPNKSAGFGGAKKGTITVVPQAPMSANPAANIDPQKPARKPYWGQLPSEERILQKLGKTDRSTVTQDDLWVLSAIWNEYERSQGRKAKNSLRQRMSIYGSMRDIFGLPTKAEAKKNSG